MNKLEKDILDSEMGLYSRYKNESEDTEKEETSLEEPAESEAETIIPEEYTETEFGASALYLSGCEYGVLTDQTYQNLTEELLSLFLQ